MDTILLLFFSPALAQWQNTFYYGNPSCSGTPWQATSYASGDCTSSSCQPWTEKPLFDGSIYLWYRESCESSMLAPIGNLNQIYSGEPSCITQVESNTYYPVCQRQDDGKYFDISCSATTALLNTYDNSDCTGSPIESSNPMSLQQCYPQFNLTIYCADCSTHTCDWYRNCLESARPCGSTGYALAYGEFFCSRYQTYTALLSTQGNTWKDDVMICLQNELTSYMQSSRSCDDIMTYAFNSHPACYVNNGVCALSLSDFWGIYKIICGGEWYQPCHLQDLSLKFWKQFFLTATSCVSSSVTTLKVSIQSAYTDYETTYSKMMNGIYESLGKDPDVPKRIFFSDSGWTVPHSFSSSSHHLLASTSEFSFELGILPSFNESNTSSTPSATLATTIATIFKQNPSIVEGITVTTLAIDNQTVISPPDAFSRAGYLGPIPSVWIFLALCALIG